MPPTQALKSLGWKVANLETQAHADLRTMELQKAKPPNVQTQHHQVTQKQEHTQTTISRFNYICLRDITPDVFCVFNVSQNQQLRAAFSPARWPAFVTSPTWARSQACSAMEALQSQVEPGLSAKPFLVFDCHVEMHSTYKYKCVT